MVAPVAKKRASSTAISGRELFPIRPPGSDSRPGLLLREAPIHRFDELIRRPDAIGAVASGVTLRGSCGVHLLERASGVDQLANAVADDGEHVSVFDDVEL